MVYSLTNEVFSLIHDGPDGEHSTGLYAAWDGAFEPLTWIVEMRIAMAGDDLVAYLDDDLPGVRSVFEDEFGDPEGRYDAAQAIYGYLTNDSGSVAIHRREIRGLTAPVDREAALLGRFIGYLNGWGYAINDSISLDTTVDVQTAPDAAIVIGDYLRAFYSSMGDNEAAPDEATIEDAFTMGVAFGTEARAKHDVEDSEDREPETNGGPVLSNGWTLEEILIREG